MVSQVSPTHIFLQWFSMALQVLESRFALRKDANLFVAASDEKMDVIWRFLSILSWIICIVMRRYDTVLRGCSPIALETLIPLLRVVLVEDDAMLRREELMALSNGNGTTHRLQGMTSAAVRNNLPQQKRKECVGPRTAFAVELFTWFTLILALLDLTNIHRLSVALFLANTIHWIRLGPVSASCLVALYIVITYLWYPAYPLRDTFLTLSGQRSWTHHMYSSYSLAFSLTLLMTDTQFLQRARYAVVSRAIMLPSSLEKNLANTPLSKMCGVVQKFSDVFFFVGFNFCMALGVWFTAMMFEWGLEVPCTGVICALLTPPVILGAEWTRDFNRALCEGILCFVAYLVIGLSVFLFVPAHSLPFTANCMASAFFVVYMAAHSPRRVTSTLPLTLLWLVMVGMDAYWQMQRGAMGELRSAWLTQLLCLNAITLGGLFMLSTALHVYRWEWPTESPATATVAVPAAVTKSIASTRSEQKQKEKITPTTVSLNVERATAPVAAVTATSQPSVAKKIDNGSEENAQTVLSPSSMSSSSVSLPSVPMDVKTATLVDPPSKTSKTAHIHEGDKAVGEAVQQSSSGPKEKHMRASIDEHADADVVVNTGRRVSSSAVSASRKSVRVCTPPPPVAASSKTEEMKREEPIHVLNDKKSLPRVTALEEVQATIAAKAEVEDAATSSVSSVSTRRDREEEHTQPSPATDEPFKLEPSSYSLALSSSPLQTSSSVSSVERRSRAVKKKTQHPTPATEEAIKKGSKSTDPTTTTSGPTTTTPTPPKAVEKAVTIPLPRGLRKDSLPASRPPAEISAVKAAATPSVTAPEPTKTVPPTTWQTRRAAPERVGNTFKENVTKTGNRRVVLTHGAQSPPPPYSEAQKMLQAESSTETKKHTVERFTSHADGTNNLNNNSKLHATVSQPRILEGRRFTAETTAVSATVSGTAASRSEPVQRGGKQRQSIPDGRESATLEIPQPRSTRTVQAAAAAAAAAAPPPPTETVLDSPTPDTPPVQPSLLGIGSDAREKMLALLSDKCSVEMSSHGDDDVPLDFAHLHIESPARSTPNSPRHHVPVPTYEASRGMPPSARHALENFAKAWMPHAEAPDTDSNDRSARETEQRDVELNVNTVPISRVAVNREYPMQNLLAPSAVPHAPTFTEPRSNLLRQNPHPMIVTEDTVERNSSNSFQMTAPNLRPHVAPLTHVEPHMVTLPQSQINPQMPMMLVQMSDGRMTLCPVVASSYTAATHAVLTSPHLKSAVIPQPPPPQQQQQQAMAYPHVALAQQQVYQGGWTQMSPYQSPKK
ncbi:hypothetical protein DQ04_03561040 [Trypanosoma grayi]|uniref:hypothetical protein n=1 Tax=Trypanosoma grayi TaxID=71804 RepID=UPI0004F4471A|nr:hypothetical protein DQ04_03561040 [Trypanosoma grayi]KEG10566.1 hypothetical protein DQ04_03561040 [Trypanosoma grayi]